MSDSELLEFLGIEERPVLSLFIEEVANKGLQQYQKVVQYGVHKGQSLYNHVVSGVFLIHSLQEILKLSSIELKVLTIAFCVHDINKTYQGTETSYGKIAVPKNVVQEIEKIGFDAFLEDWRDYIEDITELIRGHSGHNSVRGDSLDRRSDPTKQGKRRLTELDEIIRAADVADLSQSYSERKHKRDFLSHLNRFTVQQYQLIAHQITEQRGILTNIIHNQVSEFLQEKFNALPIFLYPQGTHYLSPVGLDLTLTNQDRLTISQGVEQKVHQMKAEEYGKFIKAGNQGIKIDGEVLDLGLTYDEIFAYVNTLIQRKSYKVDELEQAYRNKLSETLKDPKSLHQEVIQEWLQKPRILPQDQDLMRLGELLRTFYIFLSKHCKQSLISKNREFSNPWKYLNLLLEIENSDRYDVFDQNFHRSYVVAQYLENITYDYLLGLISQELDNLMNNEKQEQLETINQEASLNSHIATYVINNLSFDFDNFSIQDFSQNFQTYCQDRNRQSCYASSSFSASKWMSPSVLKGIKVQQFSNRLLAGSQSEPKRYIDPIVQQQFSIEKLNYISGGDKSLYLHLMPYSFMTAPFIESFKSLFQKLSRIDVSAVSLSVKEAIQFFSNQKYCVLPIKHQKAGGILVPKFSDLVGNVISLPLNPLGNNQTEKYLNAIEYALLLYKHFGVKILLSELAFPIMNLTESQEIDIFLDGVPSLLRGLVPSENLYFCRDKNTEPLGSGDILWQRLHAIREIYDLLWLNETKENELVAMAEAFSGGEGQIFFVVDRLIEKKAAHISKRSKQGIDKDSVARGLTRKLKTWMDQIVMSGSNV